MKKKKPFTFVKILLIVLTFISTAIWLASIIINFNAPFDGIIYDQEGVIQSVWQGKTASRFDVRKGDRILEIDGIPLKEIVSGEHILKEKKVGDKITYLIKRDTKEKKIKINLGRWLSITELIASAIGVLIFLMVGLFVGLKKSEEKSGRLFLLLMLSWLWFILQVVTTSFKIALFFTFVHTVGRYLAASLALHFFLVFPFEKKIIKRFSLLQYLIYLQPISLIFLVNYFGYQGKMDLANRIDTLGLVFTGIYGVLAVASLVHSYLTSPSYKARSQLKWVVWGIVISFGFLAMYVLPTFKGIDPWRFEGLRFFWWFCPILAPLSFGFAIFKYRLMEIDLVINRTIVYSVLTAVIISFYLLAVTVISRIFQNILSPNNVIINVSATLLTASLFNPARDKIQYAVDVLFYKNRYSYQKVINQFSRLLQANIDLTELTRTLLNTLKETIHALPISLLLHDEKKNRYVIMESEGLEEESREIWFHENDYFIQILARQDEPLDLTSDEDEISWESISESTTEKIRSKLQVVLCTPLKAKEKLIGFLNLGPKLSGERFSSDDVQLVSTLASQVAFASQNIYEELERKKVTQLFGRYVSPQVVDQILKADEESLQLGGKLNEVTILFADIRGFTSMSEKLPPEDVMSVLNACLGAMTEPVLKYQGTVDKYLGDAIMAIFNAPIVQEDHAFLAVKTALEIQRNMAGLEKEGINMKCGIGINTGPAVVGNVGTELRVDFTVIGDTVNTTARLCAIAKPRQILISENTYQKVKGRVAVMELPPVQVKGKEKPVVIYEVVEIKSQD